MKEIYEYMNVMRTSLLHDYRAADGKGSKSCSLIALEIAERLRSLGNKAWVVRFQEDEIQGACLTSKTLVPVVFKGRVIWYTHIVCCSEGLAYDPLCEKPIPLEQYAKEVFGEEIAYKIIWSRDQIDDVLNRGR